MPDFLHELELIKEGANFVAGVDEVGRGPLAGPVVVSAVVLDPYNCDLPLQDSKKISAKQRQYLYQQILSKALSISICSLNAKYIDEKNILQASLDAMQKAVNALSIKVDCAIIDGKYIPKNLPCVGKALIKGDQKSMSVAAASIVAKVTRDNIMSRLDDYHHGYAFKKHAGYATLLHRQSLDSYGAIDGIHRLTFAPLRLKL
ncbi:ribonuclease HII [Bartonella sp. DGB1]|uniref:ribonuclease HII n=1 Tax=Bartonella sp. DGB1 TaxID=3239807 RepID=UPI003526AE93